MNRYFKSWSCCEIGYSFQFSKFQIISAGFISPGTQVGLTETSNGGMDKLTHVPVLRITGAEIIEREMEVRLLDAES